MAIQIVATKTGNEFKMVKANGFFKLHGKTYVGDLYSCDNPAQEILVVNKEVAVTDLDSVAGTAGS